MTRPPRPDFLRNGGNVLPLPHLQETERVQRADDVVHLHGGSRATRQRLLPQKPDVLQVARAVRVPEGLHDHVRPVAAIADASEVAERLLRRADLALPLRQLVREGYQKLAVAGPLDKGHAANAREIVPFLRVLILREVADLEWSGGWGDTM